jgi:7-keto-8-aminopelargonate synthetase-like enzyme
MSNLFVEQLQALRTRSLYRQLREIGTAQGANIDLVGKRLINFSSNDYLGLANEPRLREAAIATIQEFGVGAGASRLVSGTQSPHCALERPWPNGRKRRISTAASATVGTLRLVTSKDVILLINFATHRSSMAQN